MHSRCTFRWRLHPALDTAFSRFPKPITSFCSVISFGSFLAYCSLCVPTCDRRFDLLELLDDFNQFRYWKPAVLENLLWYEISRYAFPLFLQLTPSRELQNPPPKTMCRFVSAPKWILHSKMATRTFVELSVPGFNSCNRTVCPGIVKRLPVENLPSAAARRTNNHHTVGMPGQVALVQIFDSSARTNSKLSAAS